MVTQETFRAAVPPYDGLLPSPLRRGPMDTLELLNYCNISEECRTLDADLIVGLGRGSLSDAAKLVSLALANDIKDSDGFLALPTWGTIGTVPPAKPRTVPLCASPPRSPGASSPSSRARRSLIKSAN
ncbi:hypothetical protein FB451DRAFT_1189567 [Mycena latifolia]|nr:hypothetical protein FB451DRAFT_1189567 [Mycena latifolia]